MLDPLDRQALITITNVCKESETRWMLVGALARDIQLVELAGLPPSRATDDVDIAVLVASWAEFETLRQRFIATGKFAASSSPHRLIGLPAGKTIGRRLDVVPFGPIQQHELGDDQPPLIRWPPDATVVMSIAGFEEALSASIEYVVEDHKINVASVPGLAILKLIAWLDRRHTTTKDAADFATILTNYEHTIDTNRIYGNDTFERFGFDVQVFCAWLLGADMNSVASSMTKKQLRIALESNIHHDMSGSRHAASYLRQLLDTCLEGLVKTGPRTENGPG
jgi:predicted nucleotidyltransferase